MNWAENVEQIKATTARITELKEQEALFWLKRSRVRWLQVCNSNTVFFHHSTIQKKRSNCIGTIMDAGGSWIEDPGEV